MNLSISRNGVEIGEWSEEDIRTLYIEGQLLPTDFYWKEGMPEWKQLGTLLKPPPPETNLAPSQLLLPTPSKPAEGQWNGLPPVLKPIAKGIIVIAIICVFAKCAFYVGVHCFLVLAANGGTYPQTNENGVIIESESVGMDNTLHLHVKLPDLTDDTVSNDQLESEKTTEVESVRADPNTLRDAMFFLGAKFEYDFYNADEKPVGLIVIGYDDIK